MTFGVVWGCDLDDGLCQHIVQEQRGGARMKIGRSWLIRDDDRYWTDIALGGYYVVILVKNDEIGEGWTILTKLSFFLFGFNNLTFCLQNGQDLLIWVVQSL